ncbi:PstA family ABC transporter permease [Thalassoroseus pseudoceratinae]|uniref:PstA family ABC transporter permease n=1 Tax=Thalassoroseus pseudoceratinae TaxID=2713176 RepID=UPI001423C40D|nr:ABC transporter permease subunit [Thalassoroseus pseudoceratinae]
MTPAILSDPQKRQDSLRSTTVRQWKNRLFVYFCTVVAGASVLILLVLLGAIFAQGMHFLDWDFLTSPASMKPTETGVATGLVGTLLVCGVCAICTLPLGVATAIFLEEYQPRSPFFRNLRSFIQLNITNLAGVPSVVYGILGLTAFVNLFGLAGSLDQPAFEVGATHYYQFLNEEPRIVRIPVASSAQDSPELETGMLAYTGSGRRVRLNVIAADANWPDDPKLAARTLRIGETGGLQTETSWYHFRLPFGRSVLAIGLTLMLVVLPILITASQEALRSVPFSLREGAFGLGATRWQTIRNVTLPAAIPGIMTGSIIAMSRAIGEAAPIVIISGVTSQTVMAHSLMSDSPVLPLQIFYWSGQAIQEFHDVAASGIIVLLGVLLLFNAAAVILRQKLQKPLS